jgi:uncharacterized membrane protein YhaH (DUF805 family)
VTMETPSEPELAPVDFERPGMMSPWDAIKSCFGKYATFSGRAQRPEYWWWYLFTTAGTVVVGRLNPEVFQDQVWAWVLFAGMLAVFVPSLAVLFRRLHDTNTSGWFALVALVPLIGWISLIVVLATEGSQRPNRFGPAPGTAPGHEIPHIASEVATPRPAPPRGVEDRLRVELDRLHDHLAELDDDAFSERIQLRENQYESSRQLAALYEDDVARIRAEWDAEEPPDLQEPPSDNSGTIPSPSDPTYSD